MRCAVLAWLVAVVAGCGSDQRVHDYNFLALGTLVKVSVYGEDEDAAAAAVRLLEADFARLDENYYPTRGELGRLNAALRKGESAKVSPELDALLLRGGELEKQSNGLFNPALGALFFLWGFVGDERPAGLPPPDPESIAEILDHEPSMRKLTREGNGIGSTTPLQLDLGGYAKGYALEVGQRRLLSSGISDALINAGGDILAMGQPGDRPWRIGIRHPDTSTVLAGIELAPGETVVTSGDYERFFEHDGARFHHILDPRTGYPSRMTRSVTVVHPDPVLADAAATALFVAGPKEWVAIARRMDVSLVMLVDDQHRVHLTRTMAERIQIIDKDYVINIVDLP